MPDVPRRTRSGGTELSRRKFARRQWATRWLRLRIVVVGAGLLLATLAALWAVFFSSLFAVDGVTVEGTRMLSTEQVERVAAVPLGEPLARADLDAVRERVESLTPVLAADVSRKWPDRILVRVQERIVVAVVEVNGKFRGIDEEGVGFRGYSSRPKSLPLIKIDKGTGDEAKAEGAAVIAALPESIARKVEHLELHSVDQIDLQLRDGRTVAWGSADKSRDKAKVLEVLLQQEAREYDVTVPGQPTTR